MNLFPSRLKINTAQQIKPGKILVAQKFMAEELLNRSVILILEHDETGSTGLILNKPGIPISNDHHAAEIKEPIYYGGTYDTHRVGVLLEDDKLATKAIKIAEGIYYSENCILFQEKNFREAMNRANLKAFIGFTVWQGGQLELELEGNKWCISDFNADDLHKTGNADLWEHKILQVSNTGGSLNPAFRSLLN